ncbi:MULTISPECIES: hypothetical protein [unclassified Streptomyces]|nr:MULTISPECIES: hypothetical protein [unclassified Streptomyces]
MDLFIDLLDVIGCLVETVRRLLEERGGFVDRLADAFQCVAKASAESPRQ